MMAAAPVLISRGFLWHPCTSFRLSTSATIQTPSSESHVEQQLLFHSVWDTVTSLHKLGEAHFQRLCGG